VANLFFHTLSQGLQAFMPVAIAVVWFRAAGDRTVLTAMRWGLAASFPATVAAAAWFRGTTQQARAEAMLALAALTIVAIARHRTSSGTDLLHASRSLLVRCAAFGGTMIIVARQTLEIGAAFYAAAFELRSSDATTPIVLGAGVAALCAASWVVFGGRLSFMGLQSATRGFAAVFAAHLAVYAFHELAEANLLPWSGVLHAATEPYGPDGRFGIHFSGLLVAVPWLCVWITTESRQRLQERMSARAGQPRAAVTAAACVAMVLSAVQHSDTARRPVAVADSADVLALMARPHLLYRETGPGPNFGRVGIVTIDSLEKRLTTGVACDRVSFAAGRGLCLRVTRGVFNTYSALVLDRTLQPTATIPLEGKPSRTRTSSDAQLGAATVFVYGDNYAADFSTRTVLIDLSSGEEIGELEQFSTWRDGIRIRADDFNFWGVTFAHDGTTFYAALRTAGKTYLVQGELARRRLTVLRENVECPSLSPDGRYLAYKKRVGPSPDSWRLHVLNLTTNVEQIVPGETRYVDDQVEWLDAEHLLYAMPRRTTVISDVWVVSINEGAARLFLQEAESPVVVR
jgi:hypothetical protein